MHCLGGWWRHFEKKYPKFSSFSNFENFCGSCNFRVPGPILTIFGLDIYTTWEVCREGFRNYRTTGFWDNRKKTGFSGWWLIKFLYISNSSPGSPVLVIPKHLIVSSYLTWVHKSANKQFFVHCLGGFMRKLRKNPKCSTFSNFEKKKMWLV